MADEALETQPYYPTPREERAEDMRMACIRAALDLASIDGTCSLAGILTASSEILGFVTGGDK